MVSAKNNGAQPASAVFFETVAQRILAAHSAPDLRGITVILPNLHAAQPLARALMKAAQVPALLLPEMLTLNELADRVPLDASVLSDRQRGALLYQQLRQQKWFDDADLWGMTQELLQLFDGLTRSMHELPGDAESFASAVEQAYDARRNESLQLEARLVFELWYAMQAGTELDTARAYQYRLAKLAEQAMWPLYVLRASEWGEHEQRFLEACAQHAPVEAFDVREMRGANLPPQFFAATSLEQEARAAAMQVRLWLAEGKRDIAIVVQDRVAARRMRALLERSGVLVADETGWTFATLSVSTVIDRWLTALQHDFYHHDLFDLLKSPFIFADVTTGARKAAVFRLERLLRQHSVVSGLEAFMMQAVGDDVLLDMLGRLAQAAALIARNRRHTLAEWQGALRESLNVLGLQTGLRQDDAGQHLLQALADWQQELQGEAGRYGFDEWRNWLRQQFDNHTYRDTSIDSPVRFTHLAATRWRVFDAVLLLGCDADHLPSVADGGNFFNDAVRAALGLPTRAQQAQRQRDDLHALLAMNDTVLVTWQRERDGEQGLLSPYLQLLREGRGEAAGYPPAYPLRVLRDKHQQADISTDETGLLALLALEDSHQVVLPSAALPAPSVAAEAVPASVSISGYNALVACPYQFHARHILKLNELDEVQEAIEKRDYGDLVHRILQRFHERIPHVSEHEADEMESELRELSAEVFADLVGQDFVVRAWLARWDKALPGYLAWQRSNEAAGWHYAASEQPFNLQLDGVQLRGRIDRIDEKDGTRKVYDYKTQRDAVLREKLKEPGEDVQLACYAQATGAAEAAFVSVEGEKPKEVAPTHDLAQLAQLNVERLEQVMARIRAGAGLPANGIDAVCQHCEMRGVCRKGEWS